MIAELDHATEKDIFPLIHGHLSDEYWTAIKFHECLQSPTLVHRKMVAKSAIYPTYDEAVIVDSNPLHATFIPLNNDPLTYPSFASSLDFLFQASFSYRIPSQPEQQPEHRTKLEHLVRCHVGA